eukprot:12332315-Alexandrium_andersonii.AAC.1
MSASLVGSEMCIRDRHTGPSSRHERQVCKVCHSERSPQRPVQPCTVARSRPGITARRISRIDLRAPT